MASGELKKPIGPEAVRLLGRWSDVRPRRLRSLKDTHNRTMGSKADIVSDPTFHEACREYTGVS